MPVVAVLLGAGASADAGIPTTATMTEHVRERLWQPQHQLLLDYVRHTLEADAARRRASATFRTIVSVVDIERLFASIELLIDRYEQPWSPFVASWSAGLESFAPTGDLGAGSLTAPLSHFQSVFTEAARTLARGQTPSGQSLARALQDVVTMAIKKSRPSDVSRLLEQLRYEMIQSLGAILRPTAAVDYLGPLLELAVDQGALTVATLNYDRTMELAAEERGAHCDTAIESWLRDGGEWPEAGLRLLKIHGSIDWVLQDGEGPLPHAVVRPVPHDDHVRQPAIVFGEGGKLRSEGPYLELLLRWARALEDADRLLVVGYSFRDEHINESIARWFNRDETRRITLLTPDELSIQNWQTQRSNPFLSRLISVNQSRPNQQPGPRRFWHVQRRTRDGLVEAVALARAPGVWESELP